MATPSAMQGADYVLATGRPVLYLGGFIGQESRVERKPGAMVAKGELRFVYWDGPTGNTFAQGPGGMRVTLYDCRG